MADAAFHLQFRCRSFFYLAQYGLVDSSAFGLVNEPCADWDLASLHPQHFGHLYHSAFAQSQSGYFGLSFGFYLGAVLVFWDGCQARP